MTEPTRVWITGVGVCSSLGHDFATLSDALLAGRSGVSLVSRFDTSQHPSRIAAQVQTVPCPPSCSPEEFAQQDRLCQVTWWCCESALRDAGLWDQRQALRIGLVVGVASEWLTRWEHEGTSAVPQLNPSVWPMLATLARRLQLSGPSVSLSTACASSNTALAIGREWLRAGLVDACLVGGCDMAVTPMVLAGFGNLRALSRRNDAPESASRPFDKDRDGFVLAEGGTVLVLEPAQRVRQRGGPALGELVGVGMTSDAFHMVVPARDPHQAIRAIRSALADAHVNPEQIDYVNAHGTSTPVGDAVESAALRDVLGSAWQRVPVSSTKSMTGHLLTAAAAIEAVACLTAIAKQAIPPTINLDQPDCELCHVPHTAREQPVRVAVSNSFGFGGSNTCVVFRQV